MNAKAKQGERQNVIVVALKPHTEGVAHTAKEPGAQYLTTKGEAMRLYSYGLVEIIGVI